MKQNRIVVAWGRKGRGKTTVIERLITPLNNVVVVDLFGAYSTAQLTANEFQARLPGFSRTHNVDNLARDIHSRLFTKPSHQLRQVLLVSDVDDALVKLTNAISKRYLCKDNLCGCPKDKAHFNIVLDEVDMLQHGSRTHPAVNNWVQRGRHIQLNQFYAARRPFEVDRMISAQADDFYLFNTSEPRDLKYIENYVPKKFLGHLKTLEVGDYLHYDVAKDGVSIYRRPR